MSRDFVALLSVIGRVHSWRWVARGRLASRLAAGRPPLVLDKAPVDEEEVRLALNTYPKIMPYHPRPSTLQALLSLLPETSSEATLLTLRKLLNLSVLRHRNDPRDARLLAPFVPAFANLMSAGPSDDVNNTMERSISRCRPWVWCIWGGLFLNAALGLHLLG